MCQALGTRGSAEVVSALGELMVECIGWRRALPVVPKHQNEILALLRSKSPSPGVGSEHLQFVTSSPRGSWLRPRFRNWGLLTLSGQLCSRWGAPARGQVGGVPLGSGVGGERGPTGGAGHFSHCVKSSRHGAVSLGLCGGSGRWLPPVLVGPGPQ